MLSRRVTSSVASLVITLLLTVTVAPFVTRTAVQAQFDPRAWRPQMLDARGDVGQFVSMAPDADDRLRIAYYDATNGDLKSGFWDGIQWSLELVDIAGDVGQYASLAKQTGAVPSVAYYDVTNSALKYAARVNGQWSPVVVDNSADVGQYASIAVDSQGQVAIAYYDATNTALKFARTVNGVFQLQTVDDQGDVGQYASLIIDANNNPYIAYYDATQRVLKAAREVGGIWQIQTIDSSAGVGQYASFALTGNGVPSVSYYDATNGFLKFATLATGGSTWVTQVVDNVGDVGRYTALAALPGGRPVIAYLDSSKQLVKLARFNGETWELSSVEAGGGRDIALVLDQEEQPQIAYYDRYQDLRYLKETFPWQFSTVGDTNSQANDQLSLAMLGDRPFISFNTVSSPAGLSLANWNSTSWNRAAVAPISPNSASFSSLKFDRQGRAHVSYYDAAASALRYGYQQDGTFQTEEVDNTGAVGQYSDLMLGDAELRSPTGISPQAPPTDVRPSIAYYNERGTIKLAQWNGSAWVLRTNDAAPPEVLAGGPLSAFQPNPNLVVIVYYAQNSGDLRVARWNGQRWFDDLIDNGGEATDVGRELDLSYDEQKSEYVVAYFDASNQALKYAYWTTDPTKAVITVAVPQTGNITSLSLDLGLDSRLLPRIAYTVTDPNTTLSAVVIAQRIGQSFTQQIVESSGVINMPYMDVTLVVDNRERLVYHRDNQVIYASRTNASFPPAVAQGGFGLDAFETIGGQVQSNPGAARFLMYYFMHRDEVRVLTLEEPELFMDAYRTEENYMPGIMAFGAGRGREAIVSQTMVDQSFDYFSRLQAKASQGLQRSIQTEFDYSNNFQDFVGLNFNQTIELLLDPNAQIYDVYLPLVTRN